jgi:hypothetical protein
MEFFTAVAEDGFFSEKESSANLLQEISYFFW